MGMMIDVLSRRIKDMKILRQREERRDNKVAQDALDNRFKALTTQINYLMEALQYTKVNMRFQLSESVLNDLENLLTEHKNVIREGFAEKEAINQSEANYKSVQQSIKKEWSKHYSALTSATISTLQVISGIDSEHVSKCMEGIAKGSTWTTSIGDYKTMEKSLLDAKALINELGLDQQIIAFLQKMNSGKATVTDLDDKVLQWLKTESLERRVKLSFIGLGKKIGS